MLANLSDVAIFWDIENSLHVKGFHEAEKQRKAMRIIEALLDYLERSNLKPAVSYLRVYACIWTNKRRIKRISTGPVEELLGLYNFSMVWTDGCADDRLIADVRQALKNADNPLPGIVVIMSGDYDFLNLVNELKEHGRSVWVITKYRGKLTEAADRFISIRNLLTPSSR